MRRKKPKFNESENRTEKERDTSWMDEWKKEQIYTYIEMTVNDDHDTPTTPRDARLSIVLARASELRIRKGQREDMKNKEAKGETQRERERKSMR